jgi:hypothetical protein
MGFRFTGLFADIYFAVRLRAGGQADNPAGNGG